MYSTNAGEKKEPCTQRTQTTKKEPYTQRTQTTKKNHVLNAPHIKKKPIKEYVCDVMLTLF